MNCQYMRRCRCIYIVIATYNVNYDTVTVRYGAKFKKKLMGVMVYF